MLQMQRGKCFKSASKSSLALSMNRSEALRLSPGTAGTCHCISQGRQPLRLSWAALSERQPGQHLWDLGGFLHSWHCGDQSLLHIRRFEHSVDELNLGHVQIVHLGLLEHDLHDHRDVQNRGAAP